MIQCAWPLRLSLKWVLWIGIGTASAGPLGTFFTEESSRKEIFPTYQRVERDSLILNDSTLALAQAVLKCSIPLKPVVFERIQSQDGSFATLYRAQELGKVQLMDFVVALDGEGKVMRVMLTAYRESVGGEVQSKRFLGQFTGKKSGNGLQLNRDIDGISGATLSSRAITLGVRKAIYFWNLKYGKDGKDGKAGKNGKN